MVKILGRHISVWKLFLLGGDVFIYFSCVMVSLLLSSATYQDQLLWVGKYKLHFLLIGMLYLGGNYIAGLYDYQIDYRRWWNIAQIIFSVMVTTLVNIILFQIVGRKLVLILAILFLMSIVVWRYAFSASALPKHLQRRIVIVGAGNCGRRILLALRNRPKSGLIPVGFVDEDPDKVSTVIDGLPVLGSTTQLTEVVRKNQASLIVVAITHEKSAELINILVRLSWSGLQIIDMPSLYEFIAGKVPIDHISDSWLFSNSINKSKIYYHFFKRLIDLALASFLLLTSVPLFLLIAIAIKLDSPGPVFFLQDRLGIGGRTFWIIKFRSMVQNAERDGPRWATINDHRITRVGRFLRMFRFDELPQLANVIKGEMSFIGPRPERGIFIQDFNGTIPFYSLRLLVKPGITGWAQVMFPYASSFEQAKEKLEYDIFYVKNLCFFLELAIFLKTIRTILVGRGT